MHTKIEKENIFIGIIFLLILLFFLLYIQVKVSSKSEGIESFPSSYQPYIKELINTLIGSLLHYIQN